MDVRAAEDGGLRRYAPRPAPSAIALSPARSATRGGECPAGELAAPPPAAAGRARAVRRRRERPDAAPAPIEQDAQAAFLQEAELQRQRREKGERAAAVSRAGDAGGLGDGAPLLQV